MKKSLKLGLSLIGLAAIGGICVGTYFILKNQKNGSEGKPQNPNNPDNGSVISSKNQLKRSFSLKENKMPNEMEVHFYDVGQADAILIETPKENILIDGGNYKSEKGQSGYYTPNFEQHLDEVLAKDLEGEKIDWFIASHTDADHIGGMSKAIQKFSKKSQSKIIINGDTTTKTATYKNLLNTIVSEELLIFNPNLEYMDLSVDNLWNQIITPIYYDGQNWNNKVQDLNSGDNIFKINENYWMDFIAPSIDYNVGGNNEPNESSLNFYLKCGDYDILLGGDSEGTTQDDVVKVLKENKKYDLENNKIEIYKSAHHGSITNGSNSTTFLKEILKQDSIIVVSQNDNKTFSGTPTFTETSLKNIWNTMLFENSSPIIDTQTYGDINLIFETDGMVKIESYDWRAKNPEFVDDFSKYFNNEQWTKLFLK